VDEVMTQFQKISTLVAIIVALAAVKVLSLPTSRSVQAFERSDFIGSEPRVDPHALMRLAPRDLPTETWNPI
jgi:hypothetical protein